MATIPTFTTVRAGIDKVTAALWNGQVIASLNFLLGQGTNSKDYATVRQTSGQNLATTTFVPLSFDVEDTDHAGGFSLATPTRYTPQTAGNYRISGAVGYAANATGQRQIVARVTHSDGTTTSYYAGALQASTAGETVVPISVDFPMVPGDYVELTAYQNSGGFITTFVGNTVRPGSRITFEWVSVA